MTPQVVRAQRYKGSEGPASLGILRTRSHKCQTIKLRNYVHLISSQEKSPYRRTAVKQMPRSKVRWGIQKGPGRASTRSGSEQG